MRIIADTDVCVGAGQCALVAGAVFDQDDDGIVELLVEHPAAEDEPDVRRAAALCPARAITLEE
ncbi:ferredoxin [Curtobacterium sp. Leaf261]|uniref:ferredoxin n=1 Tax=Curtobacterium sp. Leaf261 TaxID=1736311 RepID=UPI0006F78C11|nr:ferredoxin [Curtobacterium sp. Leaf261]KQO60374.1 hypothetical protein ASF23_14245 [Curtobacterium sp. Leaf261]